MSSQQSYWLGFSLIPYIGPKRILGLSAFFGDLRAAWHAPESALREAALDERAIVNLIEHRHKLDLELELEKVHKAGARLLTLDDIEYPTLLRSIDDPPPVLYVRGTLTEQDERALAIVGTRKATRYGRDVAFDLSKQLARHGVTIISGMAHGIDASAHRGALEGGGRTIAVLGCGIDVMYPANHRELAGQIAADGAIITEFPIGTQPLGSNFPRRNRVLSGMALGVLVAEAPEHSGALITAEFAADQGRDVFAIPGNIYNPQGTGSNRLIQDGARLVMGIDDILMEFNLAHDTVQTRTRTEQIAPASGIEEAVLKHLNVDPIHIDELARLCALPVAEVSGTLTILELKGLAQMVGHMQYSLTYR